MDVRTRQDALARHMRRSGHVGIAELAEATGVSRRTVLRDIAALRDQGFVIHSEAGKGGGVYLDPSSVQLTAKLSVNEVFALLISVSVMRATQTLPFGKIADAGLAKIERALPRDKVKDLREILGRLYVGSEAPASLRSSMGPVSPDLLSVFEQGFIGLRRMRFDYVDRLGRPTSREVEPQALLVLPPIWYVIGYDPDKAAFRNFRMDRIKKPALAEGSRFRRRTIDLEESYCTYLSVWDKPET